LHPLGGGGRQPPVERVEQVAVDHRRAAHQPGRVDEVPGPPLVHVDRRLGEGRGHVAHPAGVVEVDVGDRHTRQLAGVDAELGQGGEQVGHRCLAAGLDQHRGVAGDEVAGGHLVPAPEQGVDLQDPGCDLGVHVTPSVLGRAPPAVGSRAYRAAHRGQPGDTTGDVAAPGYRGGGMARRQRRSGRATGVPTGAVRPTLWDDADDPTWSVPELAEAIALRLRTAFPDEVWVRGVIRNLNPARRGGTVWFDLVEPAADGDLSRPPRATLAVVLFDAARRRVNARLTAAAGRVRMTDGTEVRIRGRITFYERGGRLQLQMSDIDPDFTLGRLAADRERVLRQLAAEGLLDRQARLPRPLLPLRPGLVTSAGSAAEHDVLDELRASGIGFTVVRADVRVQGTRAPASVARGLRAVAARGVDLVLLVRGGGAATDLAAFDGEVIARAIAELEVPVLTGIGHDIDRSVADEVAHACYKTPTACAQAVVAQVREVARRTEELWR